MSSLLQYSGLVRGTVFGLLRGVKRGGYMFLLIAYTVSLFGFVLGASTGYDAQTAEEATIPAEEMPEFTAEDLERDGPMEQQFRERAFPLIGEYIPWDLAKGSGDAPQWYTDIIVSWANSMVDLCFVVANATAGFFYANQWIPKVFVDIVAYVGQAGMFLGVGYYAWRRYRRAFDE